MLAGPTCGKEDPAWHLQLWFHGGASTSAHGEPGSAPGCTSSFSAMCDVLLSPPFHMA